jgi:NitT/TauT family transport system permease protein
VTLANTQVETGRRDLPGGYLAWQVALGVLLLGVWEWAGALTGSQWVNRPSLIGRQLTAWSTGEIYPHLATTIAELLLGLGIGAIFGVLAGLLLGRARRLGAILRPIIVAFYSIPLVSLAPLFIMFLGVEMLPKIVLVSIVVFFLLFFNTFAGSETIDEDLVTSMQLMGATPREVFTKAVLPASMAWIIAGIKIALPFALIATVTGELLAARTGLGYLLNQAAQQFDMTAIYAVLAILMAVGIIVSEVAAHFEGWLLRWRNTNE